MKNIVGSLKNDMLKWALGSCKTSGKILSNRDTNSES